jgi:hypothetical protein
MPELWSESPETGRIRWLQTVFLFLAVLWWSGPEAKKVVTAEISVNKASFVASDLVSAFSPLLLSLYHGGGAICRHGLETAMPGSKVKQGLEASSRGGHQRRRGRAVVIQGHRSHSAPGRFVCLGIFFLQAVVPYRRIFGDLSMAFIGARTPSGSVPGGGGDGYAPRSAFVCGGEEPGSDRVSLSPNRVLFALCEDLVVISISFSVLIVTVCPPLI